MTQLLDVLSAGAVESTGEVATESVGKLGGSVVGEFEDPAIVAVAHPLVPMHHFEERSAERSTEVVLALGPVETLASEGASLLSQTMDVDSEAHELASSVLADLWPVRVLDEDALRDQGGVESHASFTCEVVVTAAGEAQVAAGPRPDWLICFGQFKLIDLFQPVGDVFRRDVEESASA